MTHPVNGAGNGANAADAAPRYPCFASSQLFGCLDHSAGIAFAMSIAWDEAAECLSRRDNAGFDAAMRIFKQLREAGSANNAPASDR